MLACSYYSFMHLLYIEKYKKLHKNNKFKISTPAWNDKVKLPDGSYYVSNIQDYLEYIIKKHETLTYNPPIKIFINKTENRTTFKIKAGY